MRKLYCFLALSLLLAGVPGGARAETNQAPTEVNATSGPSSELGDTICPMIEAAARVHGLPIDFFTRVIWQESRFRPDEIGPLTRSGARAKDRPISTPHPGAERGLRAAKKLVDALPRQREFRRELRL